jgi:hypothetical protein
VLVRKAADLPAATAGGNAFLLAVPQVAATQGMYEVSSVPADSQLWQLIALCAGETGVASRQHHWHATP